MSEAARTASVASMVLTEGIAAIFYGINPVEAIRWELTRKPYESCCVNSMKSILLSDNIDGAGEFGVRFALSLEAPIDTPCAF
jgi:hypothetical protein